MSQRLRAELRGVISEDLIDLVPSSFDIIGSRDKAIGIIEIPQGLEEHEKDIADAMMNANKNIVSVLAKESERTGKFRTRRYRLVTGDPNTEVLHKESGCLFRVDPRRVYFSTRESSERDRLVDEVEAPEGVLVMFSGIAPLPIRIAKAHKKVRVTAVELNPEAHRYAVENIFLNKVADRVRLIQGDVREVCPSMGEKFNRVLMPLPRGAYLFLDIAIPMLKEDGTLHFYHWSPENEPFKEAEELISEAARRAGKKHCITNRVRVSQYSPRVWKIRLDVRFQNEGVNSSLPDSTDFDYSITK
jgi:tRNA (guanine37-N1)-methyltransferase